VIIPRKGILELKRLLEEDDAPIQLGFRKGHGVAKKKDVHLVIRLIDGTFPDYKQVIPEGIKQVVTVTREPLLSALKRISLLAAEKTRSVKLELSKKRLVLSSNNPDLGEAREEIEVDHTGEDLAIGFNARYLLDAIGPGPGPRPTSLGVTPRFPLEIPPGPPPEAGLFPLHRGGPNLY
jgi:DNA polymerase-3 subunit beta